MDLWDWVLYRGWILYKDRVERENDHLNLLGQFEDKAKKR
jgi:hypothetical protein